ncbi:MAG TPA: Yip1 family protein, partial [Pseudorhodoplanes sp.]|nr:Yip1 family protein [Pseudorhodoplanes sp.]
EPGGVTYLFTRYVAILALIPALAGFIGYSIIGVSVSAGTFRVPLVPGLINMALSYVFTFVIVYAVALVVDTLATSFRAERHFPNALKLAVYSFTPVWLAGIFILIPGLSFLSILGLYGLYLIWTGLTPLMGSPRDKSFFYALTVLAAAIVVTIVLAIVQNTIASIPRPY